VTSTTITTLLLIAIAAVAAPLLAEATGRVGVPDVVLEILLGILIGPEVLDLAHPNQLVNALSALGLGFLMFLAGFELSLLRIKGRPATKAGLGWLMSLGIAFALAFVMVSTGFALDTLVIGLALTTTALGTLLPMLLDSGVLSTSFGAYVLAIGTVGEFGPIVAVAVLLTTRHPVATAFLLLAFAAIAVATAVLATRPQPAGLVDFMHRHIDTSAQLAVRISMVLILALVWLASEFGLDLLLGAFSAGVVVRLAAPRDDEDVVRLKLEAIGFGFLVPVFFIVSGMSFDVHAFTDHPITLLKLPLFLGLFLVVRGTPALLLYRHDVQPRNRLSLAFFSATALPLVVVITTLGVDSGRMRPDNAAALVGAAMLSVLIYPLVGVRLLRRDEDDPDPAAPAA
jgi:Kef-type K+ transport system membrane component KefB